MHPINDKGFIRTLLGFIWYLVRFDRKAFLHFVWWFYAGPAANILIAVGYIGIRYGFSARIFTRHALEFMSCMSAFLFAHFVVYHIATREYHATRRQEIRDEFLKVVEAYKRSRLLQKH